MEEVVSEHPAIAECAVIGQSDGIKGEVPLAFIVLKTGTSHTPKGVENDLIRAMKDQIGAFALFKNVNVVDRLPKTRSGKILRRTLRDIAHGRKCVVPCTIEDATVLEVLEARFGPTKSKL
jgi:propionyl-CoA synthetase